MSDLMRDEFEVLFAAETAKKAKPGQVEEFESIGGFALVLVEAMKEDRIGDTYRQGEFAAAWWAWQASRECLVIDTRPIRIEADFHVEAGVESVFYAAIDAIHAAGVKTK